MNALYLNGLLKQRRARPLTFTITSTQCTIM